jgi:hypothetical protein
MDQVNRAIAPLGSPLDCELVGDAVELRAIIAHEEQPIATGKGGPSAAHCWPLRALAPNSSPACCCVRSSEVSRLR